MQLVNIMLELGIHPLMLMMSTGVTKSKLTSAKKYPASGTSV